ncbi:hypothetical protein ACN28E_41865 [Archangium lansingense]|uniref:hypothetical protein n=1 Tax=Archangium lansingense TaxID=2995310 RepID=UPI003B7C9333
MNPKPWRSAVVPVAALFLSGCIAGAAGGGVLNAAVNTGIALGASAISRSQGGCYAACPAGTECNEATGYCDPLPCRGECSPFEECIEDKLVYQCVARTPYNGDIIVNPPKPPASASTSSASSSSAPKTDAPRTEAPRTDVPRATKLRADAPLLTPPPPSEQTAAEPTQ